MQNVIMPTVIMLIAVMPSVVAPVSAGGKQVSWAGFSSLGWSVLLLSKYVIV